jgi:predicted Zn-dependent protease
MRVPALAILFCAIAAVACSGRPADPPSVSTPGPTEVGRTSPEQRALAALSEDFYAGDHARAIRRADEFLAAHELRLDTFAVLLWKAEAHLRLGQDDPALEAFERAVPIIEQHTNVGQRRFAWVFFRLGGLYRRRGQPMTAIRAVESGLVRAPQSLDEQILLGKLFREAGQPERALAHFAELQSLPSLTPEHRVVLAIKIERLGGGRPAGPGGWPEANGATRHSGFGFALLPLNAIDPRVSLSDLCLLLESKWLVPCRVLPAEFVDEAAILDRQRAQYDADRMLDELNRSHPPEHRPSLYLVAITGRDIFGRDTRYVFSWQDRHHRVGVASLYRFVAGLADYYEPDVIATRRVGVQLLSTSGSLLGFTRPTRPDCPMAYPHDFAEFLQKRSKLCDSEIRQRDDLAPAGGRAGDVPGR